MTRKSNVPAPPEASSQHLPPQVPARPPHRRGRRRRDAGLPDDRQGAGRPDRDALAEHLAVEGHLPRVRARLRQEGQRHDRRRPQDRGAARRRGGAGLRPARRRVQGHAGRRPRRAGLPLRQAERAGAVEFRPGLRHGRQHAAVLAQVRRRQGTAGQALRLDRRQRAVVPVRPDGDAAAGLVQEADHQARRLQGPEVPHQRPGDRPVHRDGRGGERAARRRDRAGDGPRPARRRPSSTTPPPTASSASPTSPRSACCRATTRAPRPSRSCSTSRSTMRCRRR